MVPPGRLERPHPAPEAGALSAELWGLAVTGIGLCHPATVVYHMRNADTRQAKHAPSKRRRFRHIHSGTHTLMPRGTVAIAGTILAETESDVVASDKGMMIDGEQRHAGTIGRAAGAPGSSFEQRLRADRR